ncbi:NmrA family NAD(P)-binding protein [Actinomadura parmotrematis]|uniref:NmrA family NAD(P)-binding protein n=1 Tax=Actinomadura parmotrematis TaxID=2864039 RepID=A0ABS7FZK3_9ACTN|nr:NmrA family NAD(P)-binding protein [Actinomadura parmotrematis]MBW8485868.1 NmrA family NAD(P)-binding protein [Actinomadura parmotrematis]
MGEQRVVVTGATGNVGRYVLEDLRERGVPVRAATPHPRGGAARFDWTDAATWRPAFEDASAVFVVRPPQLSDVARDMVPALDEARRLGVRRFVLLSLQGAERNPVVPHHKLERYLRATGDGWTFVRPSFFMQNLSTTHAADVRDHDRIIVPAGGGRTAFVDVRDVAAVAAAALADDAHAGRAYTPTGPDALTYDQVASVLSAELGRPVDYVRPSALQYWWHARRTGMPPAMALVTLGIYTTARLGLAAGLTGDVERVTGRPPRALARFAHDERAAWLR